jgi:sulfide:quinone oxidoreductase
MGKGIQLVEDEIYAIDVPQHRIATGAGDVMWDYLIIALGVVYDWDAVPGSRAAYSFYDRETSLRLRDRILSFEAGSIVIGIGGSPYRCPPAPFEAALMIDTHLRERGIRKRADLTVAIPEPRPLSVAGPEASRRMEAMLEERGVTLLTDRHVSRVDGTALVFDDASRVAADVPITIPVHRLPRVVADSGVAHGNPFVPVDRATLETSVPGVFAIGDVNRIPVGQKAVPKAGVFASAQGRHAAGVVAHRLNAAADPGSYDGVGNCFLMLGAGVGAELGGDFFADGGPAVSLGDPSPEGRMAKSAFEAAWAHFEI